MWLTFSFTGGLSLCSSSIRYLPLTSFPVDSCNTIPLWIINNKTLTQMHLLYWLNWPLSPWRASCDLSYTQVRCIKVSYVNVWLILTYWTNAAWTSNLSKPIYWFKSKYVIKVTSCFSMQALSKIIVIVSNSGKGFVCQLFIELFKVIVIISMEWYFALYFDLENNQRDWARLDNNIEYGVICFLPIRIIQTLKESTCFLHFFPPLRLQMWGAADHSHFIRAGLRSLQQHSTVNDS